MDTDQSSRPSRAHIGRAPLVVFLVVMLGGILFCLYLGWAFAGLGTPPARTLTPNEVTAISQTREARVAAAKAAASSLVRATGVITSIFPQPLPNGARICFDGERLWVNYANQLIALDPESREIVTGPISFDRAVADMIFDGKQLWISQPFDFRQGEAFPGKLIPIDVVSGKPGLAIEADVWSNSLTYDGKRLWFETAIPAAEDNDFEDAIQAIDPVSRQVFPPIATGTVIWDLVADKARQVLWIVNSDGKMQQYDLRQNVLRDTPWQFKQDRLGAGLHFDGQRLWTVRGRYVMQAESIGQALDVDTGEITDLASSTTDIGFSILGGKHLWLSNRDWTVQSFNRMTGQLGPAVPVYGYPGELEFDGQRLWIVLHSDPYAGGTVVGLQYLVPNDD